MHNDPVVDHVPNFKPSIWIVVSESPILRLIDFFIELSRFYVLQRTITLAMKRETLNSKIICKLIRNK